MNDSMITDFWNLPRVLWHEPRIGHASNKFEHPHCTCGKCRVLLAGRWVCLAYRPEGFTR